MTSLCIPLTILACCCSLAISTSPVAAQPGAVRAALPPLGPLPSLDGQTMPRDVLPNESAHRERLRAAAADGGVTCILEPKLVTEVGSPVDGVIDKVFVDRGDRVRIGQVVAKVKSAVEEAEIEVKRARVEAGRRKNARNEELFKKQLISEQEKDDMETEYVVNRAEFDREVENVKLRTILSPVNGVVLDRYLWAGELIRADKSKVVKLAQIDPLNVEVVAPMKMFGSVKLGAAAEVSLEPLLKGAHQAKVVIIDSVIDGASGTFGIRLEIPNPGDRIPAGIRCKVRFL